MRLYFPIAKVDGEQRMVWGYASTEATDDQGETVTRAALAAALDDYMRFANIREMHQPSAVGVAKEAAVDDKGLYLGAKIVDADAWAKVVEGVYKGFSIGGSVTRRDPADRRLITGLTLTEISVVDRPANPEAVFDCWKRFTGAVTGGDMSSFAAAPRPPVQVWDCGAAAHRHLTKAEAMRCIERAAPAVDKASAAPDDDIGDGRGDGGEPAVDYADPGYQPDGKRRYPIDSERHIRAAWAFIHQPQNARAYTAAQLEHIKQRIAAAWRERIDRDGPPGAADRKRVAGEPTVHRDASLAQRLRAAIAALSDLADALLGCDIAVLSDGPASPELAAMSGAGTLRKIHPAAMPITGGLARLADEIVPRLDALQKRVEDIARTPLPAQTLARGVASVAKWQDGGRFADDAEIVAALARMSEEQRTLTLIKAAHASPIAPLARTAR